ncbi:GNAT family N-acetyltransferase [Pseudoclavibacter sp. RFBB5]|uniref:GNAT family N-acetyltransferase n=1 Tax=Pseudoclavibacter sp. RFBB5 TaxID=2080574 RepID=UPI000CE763FE|nr:GNAT family N-acetyltransferase [Pseudoclavibacter sp. RFBB5]PPG33210.1 hypothetical protein C5B97_00895 [Pseudoclavibacter sp. RFBB5]
MTQTASVATQDARATPSAAVRVRESRPADWPEVVRVSEAAFAAGPYGHLPVGEERQRLVRDVEGRAAAGSVLVAERLTERRAEQASEILGTLSIARAGAGPSRLAVADEAEVRLLAVSPTAQRLGVARRLMLAASETALGWGASALVLDTGDRNSAAQALYEGLGYRRTNEPGQPGQRGVASEGRIPHVDYRLQLQPAPGVVVRLVRPSEVDAVAELSLRAYELEYSISGSYRDDIISVGERAAAHQVWVAVDPQSGELLGSVATPKPGEHLTSLPQRDDELDFRLLAVDPSARGRGVGAALTTLVIELARLRGLRRVVMNSGPQMVRAHRLYERLGFSILESRVRTVDPGDGRAPFQLLAFSIDV